MKLRQPHSRLRGIVARATLALFTVSGVSSGQSPPVNVYPSTPPSTAPAATAPAPGTAAAAPAAAEKPFSKEELEQLVAPIALYPDSLLAQVMMASTYPLDIVSAERWVKANPKLKDKALEDALQNQPWDPAVKSLAVLPQVLAMMSEKLDWTQKLGDAVLAQQADVMATAQALRAKAVAQGTLKDSKEQKVVTEKIETTTVIKIEPTNPEVVYVPTYNPSVVYGGWPYPAYPPYYYYPPGYVAGGALLGFTAGVIVGGALWGNANWGGNNVNVNVNKYNNFNKANVGNGNWNHNADRRGAVPYKDKASAQKYDRGNSQGARNGDRGRDSAGQQGRGDGARAGSMDSRGGAGAGDRGGGAGANRSSDFSGTRNSSAFDSGGGRAQARETSSRGASSMSSSRGSSGGGARAGGGGGGGRGGGGGGRGGGGRR